MGTFLLFVQHKLQAFCWRYRDTLARLNKRERERKKEKIWEHVKAKED